MYGLQNRHDERTSIGMAFYCENLSCMGYSVEFFDMLGNTVAVVTLPASALRRLTVADRPFVRQVNSIVEP